MSAEETRAPGLSDGPDRKLGVLLATTLVAGNMIGSGIYLLPASTGQIGSASILGWIIAIVGALILAGVFARLTALWPRAGGMIGSIQAGLGRGAGFVGGFVYWVSCWIGNVAIALAATGYLAVFFPPLARPAAATLSTIAILWVLVAANIIGPRFVARFEGWTLAIGLLPVLSIALAGWFFFDPKVFAASWNVSGKPLSIALPQSVALVLWAFLGLESASVVCGLVRDPVRVVPIATVGGVGIAAAVYLSACGVVMGILPASSLAHSNAPFADVVAATLGASAAAFVAACAALKACGTLGGWILVTAETAQSGATLGYFGRSSETGTGRSASTANLLGTGLLMSLAVVASSSPTLGQQFSLMISGAVVLSLFVYLLCALSLLKLSVALPPRSRVLNQVLAVGAGGFCLILILASDGHVLLMSLLTVGLGVLVHMLVNRGRSRGTMS